MSKEYKKYELKNARRPRKGGALLNTVAIHMQNGVYYYCYISFSPKLAETVGKKLPRGISPTDPAFLHVVQDHEQRWNVYAQYCGGTEAVLLWRTVTIEPPSWLKFYKPKGSHGNPQTHPA